MNGFRHIFSGFLVSPVAIPIISVLLKVKAKFMISNVANSGNKPLGSQPCFVPLLNSGADVSPSKGIRPKMQAKLSPINTSTVATLIKDSQSSDSAKVRVELRLDSSTPATKISIHSQIEVCGNHSWARMVAAVNSVPKVADQPSQYIQDTI